MSTWPRQLHQWPLSSATIQSTRPLRLSSLRLWVSWLDFHSTENNIKYFYIYWHHGLWANLSPGLANRTAEKVKPSALDMLLLFKESVRLQQLSAGSKKVALRDQVFGAIAEYNKTVGNHRVTFHKFHYLLFWFLLKMLFWLGLQLRHGEWLTPPGAWCTTWWEALLGCGQHSSCATTTPDHRMQAPLLSNNMSNKSLSNSNGVFSYSHSFWPKFGVFCHSYLLTLAALTMENMDGDFFVVGNELVESPPLWKEIQVGYCQSWSKLVLFKT